MDDRHCTNTVVCIYTQLAYILVMNLVFFEAPVFSRVLGRYFDDDAFANLQAFLRHNPGAGAIIRDTGGIRKLRWRDPLTSKGKRGGLRVIYYWWNESMQIYLLTVYRKNEMSDLTPEHRQALRLLIENEKALRRQIK